MALVSAKELGLGDVVKLFQGPYGYATVKLVNEDGSATVFRPFVHTGDFSYTAGVICYVGIEEFKVYGSVELVERGPKLN